MTFDEFTIKEEGNNHPSTFARHNTDMDNAKHFGYTNGMEFRGTIINYFDDNKQVQLVSTWKRNGIST